MYRCVGEGYSVAEALTLTTTHTAPVVNARILTFIISSIRPLERKDLEPPVTDDKE
jgi:hypothetical protein